MSEPVGYETVMDGVQVTKTGECNSSDGEGNLFLNESWVDAAGNVTTTTTPIQQSP